MKFAKELEEELVPEWRAKYFNYKLGKKKVKAVSRALKSVNSTPRTPGRQLPSNLLANAFQSPIRNRVARDASVESTPDKRVSPFGFTRPDVRDRRKSTSFIKSRDNSPLSPPVESIPEEPDSSAPRPVPRRASTQGFSQESTIAWESGGVANYGSFVPSPSNRNMILGPPALELPDPAMPPEEESYARHNRAWRQSRFNPNPHTTPPSTQLQSRPDEIHDNGASNNAAKIDSSHLLPKRHFFRGRRTVSTPGVTPLVRPKLLKRMFSTAGQENSYRNDVPLEAYREVDARQAEFFGFLDKELEKIESFYKMKEAQASTRLQLLRDQLHEMRDRRIQEIRAEQLAKEEAAKHHKQSASQDQAHPDRHRHSHDIRDLKASATLKWMKPFESVIGIGPARIGKTSKFLQSHTSPPGPLPHNFRGPDSQRPEGWRDFSRRPTHPDDVPYRSAKRKLKLALQEFYRGLELLKAYALTNRTAFRKINKKYDKAVKARPTQRYMSEKVNKAWFVQSEVLEGQIVAVEDLYARYFERGNHKVAVGKLRSRSTRAGDHASSVFRNGLMLAGGAVFGVQGIVYGAEHLYNPDPVIRLNTSYLLQIYAGYFLALFLFLLFCVDCKIWTRAKINYPFIFEFDTRHSLNWHQLAELPCFFFFFLGLFVWLNFQQDGANVMFLYWPVLLIGITLIIMFLPAPVLYHQSREWWAYSNFRLLLAGLYPVEFRDFFLGDMYCSQTYSVGNLELFFCLYAHNWIDPAQCNSSHSRLLGFFSTVPGIWRALQCLRRYYDTRNAFPHLANCAKYTLTIMYYVTLSLYRIHETASLKALFITFATLNAIYCSVWDLAMDWSLCNYYAEHIFLRNVLGFKNPVIYYVAMILDPILRFNWIFYAIFRHDVQHSALLSFFVGFSEVCRRGIWSLFRVENEHCTNVGRFRASRDVPLPYDLLPPEPSSSPSSLQKPPRADSDDVEGAAGVPDAPAASGSERLDADATATTTSSSHLEAQPSRISLRRRNTPANTPVARGIARVGTIMTEAHAQDFERKRKPATSNASGQGPGEGGALGGIGRRGDRDAGVGIERSPHHEGHTVGYGSSDEDEDDLEEEELALEAEEAEIREETDEARQAIRDAGGVGIDERDMAFVDPSAAEGASGAQRR